MLFELLAVSAAILLNGSTAAAQIAGTPCESVSVLSSAFMSLYPTETVALVSAQVAEDCLKSIPIIKDEDLALIDEMELYLDWQSDLDYLREPPKDYPGERVDVLGELNRIRQDVDDEKYSDEYTLMCDLSSVLTKAHDFHLGFRPDIRGVFQFSRGNIARGLRDEFAIVSVSEDGKEVPKLYNWYDVIFSEKEGWTPSPISEINNQSAEDYVQNWSLNYEYLEDHARYNRLFPHQASISQGEHLLGGLSQFGRSNIPAGDYTTVKHDNGTIAEYINTAMIPQCLFDGVVDAESFYLTFLNGNLFNTLGKLPDSCRTTVEIAHPTPTGYPTPATLHPEAIIGGYYLGGKGYEDVAVLSVPSFQATANDSAERFQELVGEFLTEASATKTKLVIDLRGNGGGAIYLGYDLFKQLFPSMDPYGASIFRANEVFNLIGQGMSQLLEKITYEQAVADYQRSGTQGALAVLWSLPFNYKDPIKIDGTNFTSWEDFFGPQSGTNSTIPSRKDLNNFFGDDLLIDVTGYRDRASKLNKKQPFESKNIVLLQDGACGSTCAIFSEFMKSQGGVQQIVVGGLPKTGPMQSVAGSKGSQVYDWATIQNIGVEIYNRMPENQDFFNTTQLGALAFAQRPLMRSTWQNAQQSSSGVNLRDNIRMNDTSVTPLEFVYEAADCRLFYTADMVRNVTNVWKKVVDAHWGDTSKVCVDGSTGHPSSLSGNASTQGGPAQGGGKKSAAPCMSTSTGTIAIAIGLFGVTWIL